VVTTPARLVAKKMGFRELIDFGISTLKVNVKKSPDMTLRFVRTMVVDGIHFLGPTKKKPRGDEALFERRERRDAGRDLTVI
jgi:hypothetical protein